MTIRPTGLLARIAADYHVDADSFVQVKTAVNDVYTNGNWYVKICPNATAEAAIFSLLYPQERIDTIALDGMTALVMPVLGKTVPESDFSLAQFDRWLLALQAMAMAGVQRHAVPQLDIARVSTQVRERLGTAPDGNRYSAIIEQLLAVPTPRTTTPTSTLLHGDPNFRNVVFASDGTARLIDFDASLLGPIEWDIANILMVCQIAGRADLYNHCLDYYRLADLTLVDHYLAIRLAQTLVHTLHHVDFETHHGLTKRLRIIDNYLQHAQL